MALAKVRHLQDPTDPTSLALDTESHADFLAQLRFSTHTLTDNQVGRLSDQELQTSVSAFLDLRRDGFALHQKSKRVAILEFTRAMDSSVDWEAKKDAEKRARYAPVLDFFNSLPENLGWTLMQFNFTAESEARSPMSTGLSPSPSYPRLGPWASPRSPTSKKYAR